MEPPAKIQRRCVRSRIEEKRSAMGRRNEHKRRGVRSRIERRDQQWEEEMNNREEQRKEFLKH